MSKMNKVVVVTEEEVEKAIEAARFAYTEALSSGVSLYGAHAIFEDELKDRLGWQFDEDTDDDFDTNGIPYKVAGDDEDDESCTYCIPAQDLPIL